MAAPRIIVTQRDPENSFSAASAFGERQRVSPKPNHANVNEFQRKLRIDFPAGRGTMGAMAEPTTLPVHDDERWRAVLGLDLRQGPGRHDRR